MKRPPVSLVGVLVKLQGHTEEIARTPITSALGRFAVAIIGAREGTSAAALSEAVDAAMVRLEYDLSAEQERAAKE